MLDATLAPVETRERISSVDTVRGFALLGILLMNVVAFGFPFAAYDDPSVIGGASGPNLAVWAVNYILFEGKMRAIFSMLFGAGIVILTSRAEQRGAGLATADIYYRRTLWLIAFGLLHAYLFWYGDILFFYGIAGLFLFVCRNLPPGRLLIAGVIVLAVSLPLTIAGAIDARSSHDAAASAQAAKRAGKKLTASQEEAIKSWDEKLADAKPDNKALKKTIDAYRGNFFDVFGARAGFVILIETSYLYRKGLFDVAGMMLIGMGLLKLGFFSAARTYREYAAVAAIGYACGIAINCMVVYRDVTTGFAPEVMAEGTITYHLERLAVALAHVSVLMMVCKAGWMQPLTSRLAAVGQMALTNYLLDTVVCTTIFNGYGFGQFARWQRWQLYILVGALWTFQLIASKIWLAHFRFGPMEWVWRSLTYWQKQPMRLSNAAATASAGTP